MPHTSATFTTEFRHEFEVERERWLQKRFLWYSGILGGWNALKCCISLLVVMGIISAANKEWNAALIEAAAAFCFASMFGGAFVYVRKHPLPREQTLRLVGGLIIAVGLITL
ncbi:MAG: hypothetical protein JNK58_13720, partial [Phycisphaerae bacterium]|nr:hypothetical protein [Phycisphaerae bacterium]